MIVFAFAPFVQKRHCPYKNWEEKHEKQHNPKPWAASDCKKKGESNDGKKSQYESNSDHLF